MLCDLVLAAWGALRASFRFRRTSRYFEELCRSLASVGLRVFNVFRVMQAKVLGGV